ncbi:MAG: thiamine-phosphate kinase [Candidatus Helarchaeota archaeon]
MKISNLNEQIILKIFRKNFITMPNIFLGVNKNLGEFNDAGVIELDNGALLVVTTDMIGLKTHIPDIATPEQVGKKAITVNVSDLAAMGARPIGMVISVGIPQDINVEFLEKVAMGMNKSAEEYGTCIFGGDINKTDDLIIAGTALGLTTKNKLITRNNAKNGDIVCVTGTLGDSAAGYFAWKNNLKLPTNIQNVLYPKFLEPIARIKESLILKDLGIVSSCGDISDGLGWELYKTSRASKVSFVIHEESLPIQNEVFYVANKLKLDPLDLILYYGEDFELLLTIYGDKWKESIKKAHKLGVNLIKIGEVSNYKENNILLRKDNTEYKIKNVGYDQFKS